MKVTLGVFDPDGQNLFEDSYHVPNDLAEWLGPLGVAGPARQWGGKAPHDMRLDISGLAQAGDAGDPLRLEYRWIIDPCHCLSCQIPADAGETSRRDWPRTGLRPNRA